MRAVAAGSWPVWDNSIGFRPAPPGRPERADPVPATWLNLVVLPWTYYTLFVLFHLPLAGLGIYALGREAGLRRESSLVAAAAFLYGGPLVSLVNVWHHFAGAAYVPWVLRCGLRTARTASPRDGLLLGAVLSGQVLAGSADMCAMSLLVVGALFLVQVDWKRASGSSTPSGAARRRGGRLPRGGPHRGLLDARPGAGQSFGPRGPSRSRANPVVGVAARGPADRAPRLRSRHPPARRGPGRASRRRAAVPGFAVSWNPGGRPGGRRHRCRPPAASPRPPGPWGRCFSHRPGPAHAVLLRRDHAVASLPDVPLPHEGDDLRAR